jgi:oligoribonuclease
MTGLEPETDRILEVAVIVTDFKFNELVIYEAAVSQSEETLSGMNEWVKEQDKKSGLSKKVREEGVAESKVIKDITALIKEQFDQPAVLAGNSIHQDRRFIRKWWPEVDQLLHYRMLDVSSFKVLMQGKYQLGFNKPEVHRALNDIRGSIEELKYYLSRLPKVLKKLETAQDDQG